MQKMKMKELHLKIALENDYKYIVKYLISKGAKRGNKCFLG